MFDERVVDFGLSFDDVLLIPRYSDFHPNSISVATKLTKNININVPILSSAMDTVTESKMAVSMALNGGIGIIHKNMSLEDLKNEILTVKNFCFDKEQNPNCSIDNNGKLRVGVACSVNSEIKVVEKFIKCNVDLLVVDSAHGHTKNVGLFVKTIKQEFPNVDIIVGNVSTSEGALYLIENGADSVKVGMGPGSICTTRIVAGIGVPQFTAILNVFSICKKYDIPVIADGGIRFSGDITKAIGAGASSVMIGKLFASAIEAPGKIIEKDGKKFKVYRGMGSIDAMKMGSSDRYFQNSTQKLVAEGISGEVLLESNVKDIIFQLIGGLRSGMGYCGCSNINELKNNAKFLRITNNGLRESHPHDILNIEKCENYGV